MATKDMLIDLADKYIREDGYNAFSYADISREIGIKTASIHYHFPSKTDLGVAVIRKHLEEFRATTANLAEASPMQRLLYFLDNYSTIRSENKVCLVGSLATAFNTLEKPIQQELKIFADEVLNWMITILADGKAAHTFHFDLAPRTKAILIVSNMLAIVQLARLTGDEDVMLVKNTIINDLTQHNQ